MKYSLKHKEILTKFSLFKGIEGAAESLEQLWISYNQVLMYIKKQECRIDVYVVLISYF